MFELIDMLIVRPITNILFVIYGFVGDFGLAIILFTVLVKICCWPLMKRQLHQTRLMRKIQPQLAEIKKNCNGNRQLESIQMMDLYKRNNIKPFRSVLTMIIQLPIFIALYTAVRVMVLPTPSDNLSIRAYPVVREIGRVNEVIGSQETYLDKLSAYNQAKTENPENSDLAAPEYDFHPKLFGIIDLDSRPGFTSVSAAVALVFALISTFVQYYTLSHQLPSKKSQKSRSFRQIMQDAADGKEPDQSELNAVMSSQMSKITPIFMLLFMINLPGALVFYYMISTSINGVQQKYILSKKESEMEASADKAVVRELNKIQEAELIDNKHHKKSRAGRQSASSRDVNGAHITKVSAKSKGGTRKKSKKSHNKEKK